MTARKQNQPVEVTTPAIPADIAFANAINATRDAAVVDEQALASQKAARIGQMERDMARLHAAYDADIRALDEQLNQQVNIIEAADAALFHLTQAHNKPNNVVAMAAE
jgi:phage host-nuclease inhibitor protein Gam